MSRKHASILVAAAFVTLAARLAFLVKAPLLRWAEQPFAGNEIQQSAPQSAPLGDALLLLALLGAYAALVWVTWTSEADLPWSVVWVTAAAGGVLALFTYPLFAEDVYVILANIWSFAVAGINPYIVPPNAVPGNPYQTFISWGALEYVYGPVWLPIGAVVMQLAGPGRLLNVLITKILFLGALWLMGVLAWRLAQARGSQKSMSLAALILWNPLLVTDGVMTPHLDLPMAAACLGALLAWTIQREGTALGLFVLSVGFKFITVLLLPSVLLTWAVTGVLHRPRRPGVLVMSALTGSALILLWPDVWEPFLHHGLPGSLRLESSTALIPNLLAALPSGDLLALDGSLDRGEVGRRARWLIFIPFWLGVMAVTVRLVRQQRCNLPQPLLECFALGLLGYHVLFTSWVLPWHFLTALTLCLVASSRWGLAAGFLVTASGLLHYAIGPWVWQHPWDDPRWIGWLTAAALLAGPIGAMLLLVQAIRIRLDTRLVERAAAAS